MVRVIADVQPEYKHAGIESIGAPAVSGVGLQISDRVTSLGTNRGKTRWVLPGRLLIIMSA